MFAHLPTSVCMSRAGGVVAARTKHQLRGCDKAVCPALSCSHSYCHGSEVRDQGWESHGRACKDTIPDRDLLPAHSLCPHVAEEERKGKREGKRDRLRRKGERGEWQYSRER